MISGESSALCPEAAEPGIASSLVVRGGGGLLASQEAKGTIRVGTLTFSRLVALYYRRLRLCMYCILGPLCTLGLIVSAFLIMFGIPAGKRLLVWTLALAVAVPLGLGLAKGLLDSAWNSVGKIAMPRSIPIGFILVGLTLVAWAFLRFLLRRRRLQGLLGRPQTSLKKRVDRS